MSTSSTDSSYKHNIKKKVRKRRKKTDLGDLDFVCGCGKEYKSYPALFTHIKQKHNGKAPPNTIRPLTKRGRPKVIFYNHTLML